MNARNLVFMIIFTSSIFTANTVFADRCPYCRLDYGDPMPGDEASVYALRADHEASCPMRPSGGGEDGGGYGAGSGYVDNSWVIQEQERAAQQERIRLEQEQARQRRMEDEARKAVETERKRLEWQQNKEKLLSALKGTTEDDFRLKGGGEETQLKPKGELQTEAGPKYIFGLPLKGNENALVVKTRELDTKETVLPSSDMENLRRSLWLYKKARTAATPEEARFLSEQADEAAQGHPLLVEVPAAGATSEPAPEEIEGREIVTFQTLTKTVEQNKSLLGTITEKRMYFEHKKTEMKSRLDTLEREIDNQQSQTPAASPPVSEIYPVVSQTVEEAPETEKKKSGEDLMAEFLALQKEMEKTDKETDRILKEETNAEKALEKSQQKLDAFIGKK